MNYYEKIIKAAENALSNRESLNWNEIGPEFAKLAKELSEDRIKLIQGIERVDVSIKKMGESLDKASKALSGGE